ncbi:MAG: type II secretion system protein [Nitrospirae bacterium]|nr:type II secretion system protein [Nitrospirota bacterium]
MNLSVNSRTCERGFSLVELLIALAIMIIALSPLMDSITSSFQSAHSGEKNTILVNYAREKMEDILARNFSNVPQGSSFSDTVAVFGKSVNRNVLVELYDGNGDSVPDTDLKKITVTVEWVTQQSLMADY